MGGGLLVSWLVVSCFSKGGVIRSVGLGVVMAGVCGSGEVSEMSGVLPLEFSPVS